MAILYRIEYKESGGTSTVQDGLSSTTYDQLSLSENTTYEARVQAYDGAENSAWTDWEIVTTLSSSDNLTATDIITAAPVITSPSIGQAHSLTGTDIEASAPVITASEIGQIHALTATNIVTAEPVISSPTLGETSTTDTLTGTDIVTGSPVVSSPNIGQVHALTGSDITTASPVITSPSLQSGDVLLQTITTSDVHIATADGEAMMFVGNEDLSGYANGDHLIKVFDGSDNELTAHPGVVGGGLAYGPELLTNEDFSAWTGDDPDGFDLLIAEDPDNYVTEDPAGVCKFVSDGTWFRLDQSADVIGSLCLFEIDVLSATEVFRLYYSGASYWLIKETVTKTANMQRGAFTIARQVAVTAQINSISLKKTTDIPSTGLHLVDSAGGSTNNIVSQDAGFDPSNIARVEIWGPPVTVPLTGTDITTPAPVITSPTIGQIHALTGQDIGTDPVVISSPTVTSVAIVYDLTGTDITTAAPVISSPEIGQIHALTAESIETATPVIEAPVIGQIHALASTNIVTASVVITSALLNWVAPVTPEERISVVAFENRVSKVPAESRISIVPAESRISIVPAENRTMVVEI